MAAWTDEDVRNLRIADVSDDEMTVIQEALERWRSRLGKNVKRSLYYDTAPKPHEWSPTRHRKHQQSADS